MEYSKHLTKRVTDTEAPYLGEYLSHLGLMESALQEPIPAASDNNNLVSRDEFQKGFLQIVNLMRELIQQIKAPIVNVNPEITAKIMPHETVQSVTRDQLGRITETHSRIE
jgi:hypothetical protein